MTNSKERSILLIGSLPLQSASAVFESVSSKLRGLAKRTPDGETAELKDWIMWQAEPGRA
jgi:hypothetical protein